jgi:hypothetical protein
MFNYPSPLNDKRLTMLIAGLISGVIIFAVAGCVLMLAAAELWAEQPIAAPADTEQIVDNPADTAPPVTDTPPPTATPTLTPTATSTTAVLTVPSTATITATVTVTLDATATATAVRSVATPTAISPQPSAAP